MATTKKTGGGGTKVICQSCGAEVMIPNHERAVTGVAIGKDSGLGTVVLPTTGSGCDGKPSCGEKDPMRILESMAGKNAEVLKMMKDLVDKIEKSGYLDVDGIVRRWIPSQCLEMVFSEDGFHKSLMSRGYDYFWKVLIDDLKRQMKLFGERDMEGFADRNRFYNRMVAADMADGYVNELLLHVGGLRVHMHKKRAYKKIKCVWMNHGKGVHVNELPVFENRLKTARNAIGRVRTPSALYKAVVEFDKLRKGIKFTPKSSGASSSFVNAYKAAGAYYTMKDLILFEGCRMKVNKEGSTDRGFSWRNLVNGREFVEREESLAVLERKMSEIVSAGTKHAGYEMLGLLKEFLSYNEFDFGAAKAKWREQSAIRRELRGERRGERRPRK